MKLLDDQPASQEGRCALLRTFLRAARSRLRGNHRAQFSRTREPDCTHTPRTRRVTTRHNGVTWQPREYCVFPNKNDHLRRSTLCFAFFDRAPIRLNTSRRSSRRAARRTAVGASVACQINGDVAARANVNKSTVVAIWARYPTEKFFSKKLGFFAMRPARPTF